jgi:hypothetical protein
VPCRAVPQVQANVTAASCKVCDEAAAACNNENSVAMHLVAGHSLHAFGRTLAKLIVVDENMRLLVV